MSTSPRTSYLGRLGAVAPLAVALAALLAGTAPASAQPEQHPAVVAETPVDWTPHIENGTVHAITAVGDTVVVGGTFTRVREGKGGSRLPRRYLVAFDLHSGRLRALEVTLDGPVYALAPGPDGTVYLGGAFRTVNGVPQRGVTRVRLDTGIRAPEFDAALDWGQVRTMARHGRWLYLGGRFTAVNGTARAGLARLDASTGTVDDGFDARLGAAGGPVDTHELALAPDGERLAAVGAFTHAQGLRRSQLVMMETAGQQARVSDWYTDAYERPCSPGLRTYLRGVDFSPDGSYLVTVTTGGMTRPDLLCGTAARFEATGTGRHTPTWVNHTGGSTLHAVAVTGPAVYVGGHQLWQDNPHGRKPPRAAPSPGPGAVPREGIAALDPDTGLALPWNPGRARGVGVQAFLATSHGLFVGSDTTRIGGEHRARIAMLPLPD